jgi:hypothetical protein
LGKNNGAATASGPVSIFSSPKLDEAAIGNFVDDNHDAGTPNNRPDTYSESANDTALRFGIRFATEQYHKTKLFKILGDANNLHYLYKEIIEWGPSAQCDNYDFNPQRSSWNAPMKVPMPEFLSTANSHHASRTCSTGRAKQLLVSILPISCICWSLIKSCLANWITWISRLMTCLTNIYVPRDYCELPIWASGTTRPTAMK